MTIATRPLRQGPGPLDDPTSPLAQAAKQPMMLGLFLPTQTGGFSQSAHPRATDWQFEYNRELTLTAERHGFEFVFGLQQWLPKGGFGGEIGYRENFLDPFIATVALGAVTTRIITISTVHILYGNWHPLHLARFSATGDHIAHGRHGLNIVTGYDQREPLMFGMDRVPHDQRYEIADEFLSVMEDLWLGEDNLTHNGRWYSLDGAYVSPRPQYGRPILVSASASPAGFRFAARHSDIVFTSSPAGADFDGAIDALPAHVAQIRSAYADAGRDGKVIIFPLIICRDTRAEALRYRDAIVEAGDYESALKYQQRHDGGDAQGWQKHVAADRILGGHLQIVGSPEDVAEAIERLHLAGFDGVQLGFYDYGPELDFFAEAVVPLLERRGLRV
jgi:FMNH2-dependent dimethyl sulfone monooxygenase